MLDMEAIKHFSIDKSDWKKVKFGDVVFEPKESVKDPVAEGIEHVVGLEHIDSEDIHLRRSASIEQSTTFTKHFSKGDVLFGRRRAYLKKAAKAEFDGICSGDITVMRAKEELLLPELLPFIVNNESFFDYAITHSAGGLSPRVKFKDLASFEFNLPPFEVQRQYLQLFSLFDQMIESSNVESQKLSQLRSSFLKRIYKELPERINQVTFVEVGVLIKLSSGKTRPKELTQTKIEENIYPVYGGNGVIGFSSEYLIDYPTIILGRVGEYCGVVHESNSESWVSDNALYVKEFLSDMNKMYISRFLEYIDLNKQQNKSSHPLISQSKVNKNKVALLDEKLISDLMLKLTQVETVIKEAKDKKITLTELSKSLTNKVF